jgi:predicted nucleic acid-binding protein
VDFFVDTNLLVAAVSGEEDRSEVARDFLDSEFSIYTSLLNVMEFRTVMTKKKGFELSDVEEIETDIVDSLEIIIPDSSDFIEANKIQVENLFYPLDCLLLAISEERDLKFVTFDSELLDNGAVEPGDVL